MDLKPHRHASTASRSTFKAEAVCVSSSSAFRLGAPGACDGETVPDHVETDDHKSRLNSGSLHGHASCFQNNKHIESSRRSEAADQRQLLHHQRSLTSTRSTAATPPEESDLHTVHSCYTNRGV
ncbi:hypothetical protein EYF80_055892 [Liparis tanakae]|uniref:Uncharacterized protein n=1 Tax=Liparis tanakae TaxID=230148 RepID=A0A4Z2EYV5_9TELE|nr:hypothetical protein EYF80_055892 [Liparis tanakae]